MMKIKSAYDKVKMVLLPTVACVALFVAAAAPYGHPTGK